MDEVAMARDKACNALADLAQTPGASLDGDSEKDLQALTEAKRAKNESWLSRFGWVLWILFTGIVAVTVGITYDANRQPPAAQQVDGSVSDLQAQVADIRDLLVQGQAAEALATAEAAERSVEALASAAAELPSQWNGTPLIVERAAVQRSAGVIAQQLSTVTAALVAASADERGAPVDVAQELDVTVEELGAIEDANLSPGFTNPWSFADQSATGLVYGALATWALLVVLALFFAREAGGLRSFLIGGDNRISTAQTQAAIWTVAVVYLALVLLLRRTPADFEELDENYLLMLGGPYAALIVGGAVTRGKLAAQELQKVPSAESQVRDVLSDDNGRPDLVDTQFFLFSMAALIGVLVAFWGSPDAVPPISGGLALLSGGGALVYLGKKAVERNAPLISSIVPLAPEETIKAGKRVVIRGANFVPPGAGGDIDTLSRLVVEFRNEEDAWISRNVAPQVPHGTRTAPMVRREVSNPSDGQVIVLVPDELTAGQRQIRVVTAAGLRSPEFTMVVAQE